MRKDRLILIFCFSLTIVISCWGMVRHTLTGLSLRFLLRPSLKLGDLSFSGGRVVTFPSEEKIQLSGIFFSPSTHKSPAVIICHGNGQTVQDTITTAAWLHKHGFAVLCFDYRGFGLSSGKMTSFYNLTSDLKAALNYLAIQPCIDNNRVGVLGLSLGTVPSTRVAAIDPRIKGLILHAPIYSAEKLLANYNPDPMITLSARYLINLDGLNTSTSIRRIKCPLLIIQEGRDEITSPKDGLRLFSMAKTDKELWFVPKAGHLEARTQYNEEYHHTIAEFFQRTLVQNESKEKRS
jgi:pimeloyl-ACP methyl ester carboxylesterase